MAKTVKDYLDYFIELLKKSNITVIEKARLDSTQYMIYPVSAKKNCFLVIQNYNATGKDSLKHEDCITIMYQITTMSDTTTKLKLSSKTSYIDFIKVLQDAYILYQLVADTYEMQAFSEIIDDLIIY